jgi:V8-like Glu-specific endopeptidase
MTIMLALAGAGAAFAQTDAKPAADAVRAESGHGAAHEVDFVNAKPRPLPMNKSYSAEALKKDLVAALDKNGALADTVVIRRSSAGDGVTLKKPLNVGEPAAKTAMQKEQFGTANLPYSTARADLDPKATNTQWPYRAAGKLFFLDGQDSFVCTASLIDRGLVVTAAHCVSEYGENRMFSNWKFIPGYRNGAAPFGTWEAEKAYVLAGYPAGSAPCDSGVVCKDDVALLVLKPKKDSANKDYYAGQRTGWFAYASGPAPYTASGVTHVTQLGYPVCLDNGGYMERNDAQGAVSSSNRDNTVFGSLMCGGSSGGPWIANFGVEPTLTDTIDGAFAKPNVVVGVTSWGATDKRVKQQGASPFLSTNIDFLVKAACKDFPHACTP